MRKTRRFFPTEPFFFVLWMIVHRIALIPRTLVTKSKWTLNVKVNCAKMLLEYVTGMTSFQYKVKKKKEFRSTFMKRTDV